MPKYSARKAEMEMKKPSTVQKGSREMWNKWEEELNNHKSRPIAFCFFFGSFSGAKRVDRQFQFLTLAPVSSFVPRKSIKTREDWNIRAGAMSSFLSWAFRPYRDSVHEWFTKSGLQCVNCKNPAAGYTYHYSDCLYEWENTFAGNLAGVFRLLMTPFCSSPSACYNAAGQTCVRAAHEYGYYPDPGKYLQDVLKQYYSHCQGCNTKFSSVLTLCGSCSTSPYCSRECQIKNRPAHKQFCKYLKRNTLGDLTKKFGRVEGNLQMALRSCMEAHFMEDMMRKSLQGLQTLSILPIEPAAEKGKLSGLPISQRETTHVILTPGKELAQVDTIATVSPGIEIPLSQVQFRSSEDYRRHDLDEIAFIMNTEATLLQTSKRWPAVKSKG
ncbi:hypothetical protein BGZ60DRAFT_413301 [Tricladium varicosporioides]|nr:hypothetical protein BGZ60DRAFT_413301 [Hymenoscyphus varicosporioides]